MISEKDVHVSAVILADTKQFSSCFLSYQAESLEQVLQDEFAFFYDIDQEKHARVLMKGPRVWYRVYKTCGCGEMYWCGDGRFGEMASLPHPFLRSQIDSWNTR